MNPERGRKRPSRWLRRWSQQFQNVNPERGRKLAAVQSLIILLAAFQNVNPERGRKQEHSHAVRRLVDNISEREPRKGTETFLRISPCYISGYNFRTRTPEGDGNNVAVVNPHRLDLFRTRTPHEPREGTEIGYDFLLMKSQPVVYVLSLQCILLMLN